MRTETQATSFDGGAAPVDTTSRRDVDRMQALLREVNEQLHGLAATFGLPDPIRVFCECGREGCSEQLELTRTEYEAARRIPTRFILKPAHDALGDGRFVEQRDGYVVIEKFGRAGAFAVRTDPRRRRVIRGSLAGEPVEALGHDYWLRRCEGFRVDSVDGRIGFVEEVRLGNPSDRPEVIVVRVGLFGRRLLSVAVADVAEVLPDQRRLVLAGSVRPLPRS